MKNIELKRVIDGEFAVVKESFRDKNEMFLKEERIYLNLDKVELFKIGKTFCEQTVSFEREQKKCEQTGDYVYMDNLPKKSENFKSGRSFEWDLTIPEGTSEIRFYFSKYEYSLMFLNDSEYDRVYKILTEDAL